LHRFRGGAFERRLFHSFFIPSRWRSLGLADAVSFAKTSSGDTYIRRVGGADE
jgi:hypothetical protein